MQTIHCKNSLGGYSDYIESKEPHWIDPKNLKKEDISDIEDDIFPIIQSLTKINY